MHACREGHKDKTVTGTNALNKYTSHKERKESEKVKGKSVLCLNLLFVCDTTDEVLLLCLCLYFVCLYKNLYVCVCLSVLVFAFLHISAFGGWDKGGSSFTWC